MTTVRRTLRSRDSRGTLAKPRSTQRAPAIKPTWCKAGGKVPTEGPVYVGLDLLLAKTACVALSAKGSFYWWRLHKPVPKEMSAVARLAVHRSLLQDFMASIPEPELICIEGYSFASRQGGHQIGEWGGVARLTLFDLGLEERVVLMPPLTLKKFVTGKGNAQKTLVLREVYRVWGIEAEDDNVADAYGLAQAAMTISTGEARYAWQRDALRRMGPPDVAPSEPRSTGA